MKNIIDLIKFSVFHYIEILSFMIYINIFMNIVILNLILSVNQLYLCLMI